jgi:hypothetical protein
MCSARGRGWCLDHEKWLELERMLEGIQPVWHRTVLEYSHKNHVPTCPGVYAIEFPSPIQLGANEPGVCAAIRAPIYIGRSETNLRERFSHHSGNAPQNRINLARRWPSLTGPRVFIWVELRDPGRIQVLESRLIECFNPPCNKIGGVRLSGGRPAGAQSNS